MVNPMKNISMLFMIAATVVIDPVYAEVPSTDAVGQWLHARAMQAALDDDPTNARRGVEEGTYRIIALAYLDAPEDVKQHFRNEATRNRVGVKRVSNGDIPSVAEMAVSLPTVIRSNAELSRRLPLPPTNLQGSMLGAAALIGMEPSGALDGLKSTGLTRFYRLDGVGIIEFNEEYFRAPGSTTEVIAELQNSRVNRAPAQLERIADDQGRSRASLVWAGENKVYSLIATGEGDVQRKAEVLQQIAAAVKD